MAKLPQSAVDVFLERCTKAARKANIELSTLSLYLINDGKVLPRLAAGGDIGTRKREAAEAELSKFERGELTSYQTPAPKPKPRRVASTNA